MGNDLWMVRNLLGLLKTFLTYLSGRQGQGHELSIELILESLQLTFLIISALRQTLTQKDYLIESLESKTQKFEENIGLLESKVSTVLLSHRVAPCRTVSHCVAPCRTLSHRVPTFL